MDSDVSTDQGSSPIHGIRDVRLKADTEQHDWSEQAVAPEVNTLSADLKSYILPKKIAYVRISAVVLSRFLMNKSSIQIDSKGCGMSACLVVCEI